VEVKVINARSDKDAKLAAEAVGNSLLCKTAWFGNDPNWGRVVAALGYSGAQFSTEKCDIYFDDIPVVKNGGDAGTPENELLDTVKKREFTILCDFNEGDSEYWVWASDVSYEYVKINADYHT
jgi:glutamate N-acetyltransferase/amino-acid N-acetyltransferase